MYRSDIDEPREWEMVEPFRKRIGRKIKESLQRAYLRDVRFNKVQIAKTVLRSLILTSLVIFWSNALFQRTPSGLNISDAMTWVISITGGATILFTGMVTDTLIERHGVFEKVAIAAIVPMTVLLAVDLDAVTIVATLVLTVITAFLIVLFVVGLVLNTTMLTRARVIVFMIIAMATFAAPVASFLVITETYVFTWVFTIAVTAVSLVFSLKNPKRYTPTFNTIQRLPGLRGFLRVIRESNAFRTALFLFFTAFPLAYHATATVYAIQDGGEYLVLGIVMIGSLPVIAAVIDNRGRKPIVYLMLLLVGIISAIYDQPGFDTRPIRYVKVGVLAFSVVLLVIISIVFSGDLSSSISRGRITSVMLFCVLLGTIVGFMTSQGYDSWVKENGPDPAFMTTISNATSLSMFVAIFLFVTIREQFQPGTTGWRDHLIRLHVIMNNGLSLVFKEFKKRSESADGDTLEDLESGGLTGLQQMLQEIANSRKRIRVLDHGDVYLIFHYGKLSTAVLFVERNLVIYREMLANFHLQLEYINKDVIQENYINQEELQHVGWLIDNYFT
ncbi:MAG: hypothetical protein JW839_18865 [Candidatus Lokiarchaeota archaeon]|nr:hypothetical protein [Candidatus Lokiarchaeota archaeon]